MRIQFTQRFCPLTDDELEDHKNLTPNEPLPYKYRLVYPRLDDIDMPLEIPGKKNHCQILFYTGEIYTVKGDFQSICDLLDRREGLQNGDSLGESD